VQGWLLLGRVTAEQQQRCGVLMHGYLLVVVHLEHQGRHPHQQGWLYLCQGS
jgi:hypothetical protein